MIDKAYDLSKYYKNLRSKAEKRAALLKEQIYLEYPKLKEIENKIANAYISYSLARYDGDKNKIEEASSLIEKYENEKKDFLASNKISPESFEPQYACKKCNDTGYVDGRICDCYIEQLEMIRPEPFLASKFDINNIDFNVYDAGQIADDGTDYRSFIKDEILAIKANIDEYIEKDKKYRNFKREEPKIITLKEKMDKQSKNPPPDPINYIFVGDESSGKTFLLNSFARYLYLFSPYTVTYIKAHDCVRTIMGTGDTTLFHQKIELADFLFIDDLGRENKSEFSMSVISDLIDYRLNYAKNTFIASKLSLKSIKDTYGEYVYNRIFNSYYPISLKGSVEYGE